MRTLGARASLPAHSSGAGAVRPPQHGPAGAHAPRPSTLVLFRGPPLRKETRNGHRGRHSCKGKQLQLRPRKPENPSPHCVRSPPRPAPCPSLMLPHSAAPAGQSGAPEPLNVHRIATDVFVQMACRAASGIGGATNGIPGPPRGTAGCRVRPRPARGGRRGRRAHNYRGFHTLPADTKGGVGQVADEHVGKIEQGTRYVSVAG